MVKKGVTCRWCGMASLVPLEESILYCQACDLYTVIQIGRLPYTNGENSMSCKGCAGPAGYGSSISTSNPPPIYPLRPPPAHGRKRALLCGITYRGHRQSLHGCINDVNNIRKLLVQRFQFPVSSIHILTEEEDYSRFPTKENIRAGLRWLVYGCESGDSLVFHYSGHGSQVEDVDGDEVDGNDECIMPVDYKTKGVILDDEINETIVRPLPTGATLHATFDSCHSGTVLDLPHVFNIAKGRWDDNRAPSGTYKGSMGGIAICFSACNDDQLTPDTSSTSQTGALTTAFIQAIEKAFKRNVKISYKGILDYLHHTLMQDRSFGIRWMFDRKNLQEPLLSASQEFRINTKFML